MGVSPRLEGTGLLLIATIAGTLAAVAPSSLSCIYGLLAAGGGLLLGVAIIPDTGPLRADIITTFGSYIGANLAFLYVAGGSGWLMQRFTQQWAHIGVRIVMAWIAAIACLMFTFNVVSYDLPRENLSASVRAPLWAR